MRCWRTAWLQSPARTVSSMAVAAAATIALAACAQSPYVEHRSHVMDPASRSRVAMKTPPRIVTEADGLPSQHAPHMRRDPPVDDPSEPFSPNYGPAPATPPHRQPPPAKVMREATLSDEEAGLIIARAIIAHEIRANR